MTTTTETLTAEQTRTAYIAGLRQLAEVLETSPEVPLPYEGTLSPMSFHFLNGEDARAEMAAAARALPTVWSKNVWSAGTTNYFDLNGSLHGLTIHLSAYRDAVCERIVTGTREVTTDEPDPAALAAVPTVTVTRTVEDVQWVCAPILAGGAR